MQALLSFACEARWLRHARAHPQHLFPYLSQQPGDNKWLRRAAGLTRQCIRVLASASSAWIEDVWIVGCPGGIGPVPGHHQRWSAASPGTPPALECGQSRDTTKRSDLAGWAEYGHCASHSRYV
jgi:hypothetical protein